MTKLIENDQIKRKKEFECACFGHRMIVEVGGDKEVYFSICEKKKGRPKWIEIVLWENDAQKLVDYLNTK